MRSLLGSHRDKSVGLFHHGMILWAGGTTAMSLDHSNTRMWEKSDSHKVVYTPNFVINIRRKSGHWYLNIAAKTPKPVDATVVYTQSEHDYLI